MSWNYFKTCNLLVFPFEYYIFFVSSQFYVFDYLRVLLVTQFLLKSISLVFFGQIVLWLTFKMCHYSLDLLLEWRVGRVVPRAPTGQGVLGSILDRTKNYWALLDFSKISQ